MCSAPDDIHECLNKDLDWRPWSGTQSMRLNPKLFLVDIKSFANSTQLSSAIGKSSRILIILLSEGEL